MPRYAARVNISGVIEVEASTYEEAHEHFTRSIGADQDKPVIEITVPASNGGPVRLIEADPVLGMIGQRSAAA